MSEQQKYAEHIREIISQAGIDLSCLDFHICEEIVSPGSHGVCFQNGGWYLYKYDDRCRKCVNGSHPINVITKFVAVELQFQNATPLTDTELEAYIYGGRYV